MQHTEVRVLKMLLFLAILLFDDGFLAASAGYTLLPGEAISGYQTLVSQNGVFELGFFSPGEGIHHYLGIRFKNMVGTSPIFWVGERIPITNLVNATLELCMDKLCIKEMESVLWSSPLDGNGSGSTAAVAVLRDNGNLVVRDKVNSSLIVWQSFDYPGDAMLPGARLGLDKITGKNISLLFTGFSNNSTLKIGEHRENGFVISIDGQDHFGSFPDWMVSSQDNGSSVLLNYPERPDFIEFLQLNLGQVSLMRWSVSAGTTSGWVPRWSYPLDCKASGFFCGEFGACTCSGKCVCVNGFRPSYPIEWGLGYFVAGCSRSLPLSCEMNGPTGHNDSFMLFNKLQGLPYNPQYEPAGSDEDCKAACLNKCYCVAYLYHSECKLWYHKLFNLSLADNPPYSEIYVRIGSELRRKRGLQTRDVAFLVIGSLAMIVMVLILLWIYRRNLFMPRRLKFEGSLVVYSYAQIKKATRNFSDKLGEGGFGTVFRGTMSGSTIVAVKKLKCLGYRDKQFRTEIQTVGMVQHKNLVHLLGFCAEGTRRVLVYEYMVNGSLDTHLFSENSSALSWNLRYQIALGIAKGLAYLHQECKDCIIHCDIKPENILLDAEFCPKITDFGMAKLIGRDFGAALTTFRGTIGYLAPEWLSGQAITHKADVYSYGTMLFEIISGRRTTEKFGNCRYFPLYAAAQVNEGQVLCLLDGRLEGNADVKELDIICRVACWCIQDDENYRPSMGQVVRMLEAVVCTELPPIPNSFQNLMDADNDSIYSVEG